MTRRAAWIGLVAWAWACSQPEPFEAVASSAWPADGAVDVSIRAQPSIRLNRAPALESLAGVLTLLDEADAAVEGELFVDGAAALVFEPKGSLGLGKRYRARLGAGARALSGEALAAAYEWSFTTEASVSAPSPSPLALVGVAPSPGANDVTIHALVRARFNRPMEISAGSGVSLALASGREVPVSASLEDDGTTIVVTPREGLAPATAHVVRVTTAARSIDGGVLTVERRWAFVTTDDPTRGSALQVLGVSPADGATQVPRGVHPVVSFSRPPDSASITAESLRLEEAGGARVAIRVLPGTDPRLVTIVPDEPLGLGRAYTLVVEGVRSDEGLGMSPARFTGRFTTSTNPFKGLPSSVVRVSPVNGATGVPASAVVVLEFSRPLDLASFASVRPSLTAPGQFISVLRSLDRAGTTVTMTPAQPLPVDTEITVVVPAGLRDVEDQLPSLPFTSTFTTRVDRVAPTVVSTSPIDAATNVGVTDAIRFVLSEPVDAPDPTITLQGPAGAVPGAVATEVFRREWGFTPASALEPQTDYAATLAGAIDLAGNALAAPVTIRFRTGGQADVSAPVFAGLDAAVALDESRAMLSWTAATDDRTAPLSYLAWVSSGATIDFTTAPAARTSATSIALPGLQAGASYAFAVRAADLAGNVDANVVVRTLRMPDQTPPSVISSLVLAPLGNPARIDARWDAATDNASTATSLRYRAYVATSSGAQEFTTAGLAFETPPGALQAELTAERQGVPIKPGRRYFVVVRAVDAAGNEQPSRHPEVSVLVPDTTPPSFTGAISVTAVSATSVRVSWPAASDDGDTVSDITYRISKRRADAFDFGAPEGPFASGLSRTLTGLAADVPYMVRVEAADTSGNVSVNASQPVAMGLDLAAPAFSWDDPALAASVAANAVELAWRAAGDNRTAAAAMRYLVYAAPSAAGLYASVPTVVTGQTATRLNGLAPGNWWFGVRAQDEAGNVDANTASTFATLAPP